MSNFFILQHPRGGLGEWVFGIRKIKGIYSVTDQGTNGHKQVGEPVA